MELQQMQSIIMLKTQMNHVVVNYIYVSQGQLNIENFDVDHV